ncbi:DsbA family protein [Jannaschia sp. KMU-145]|uniref:DsbA family protein n=1 Tax=Jannaschia halovivens TaxID=3388667 RepID=UPI00396B34E1
MRPLTLTMTATALALLTVLPAAAERSDDEIKALVLEAIRENPEIVMEAVGLIQAEEAEAAAAAAQAALDDGRGALEADPNAPILGNPDGDVTVVEFFDYNCPYCRRAGDEVKQVLALDEDVRVVMREWPILGAASIFAARAALAAREQDAYDRMHEALMSAPGRLDEDSVMRIAAELELDTDRLRSDMEGEAVQAHIDQSMRLAQSLGFSGTPSFVIGDQTAPGLVEAAQMLDMIDAVRDGG